MIPYGVFDPRLDKAVELFLRREDAERVVCDWDRDEPLRGWFVPGLLERVGLARLAIERGLRSGSSRGDFDDAARASARPVSGDRHGEILAREPRSTRRP